MRRQALATIKPAPTTHSGLWLDRFLQDEGGNEDAKTKAKASLVEQVAGLQVPALYTHFYNRWAISLKQAAATCRTATVQGRMIVGLGNTSPIETSICLHHTYGVPYIPGSAIKGLVATYARQQLGDDWAKGSETKAETPLNAYQTMFGHPESAGYLTFFDALYIPNSSQPLAIDLMTPHHMNYQQGNSLQAPTDFDSPNPVAFLSATGSYLFAIGGAEAWVNAAFAILDKALIEYGIGAKTSSGYGRMKLEPPPRDTNQDALEQFLADFNRLRPNQFASQIGRYIQQWRELGGIKQKREAAETIIKMARVVMREKDLLTKPWFSELITFIEQHS
ncbi:type III-B CRISPR module RAMP protein Cmr6 [Herpetosiphon llansteffanensis]|uniref:type III-B CRISPR module RAMP protein Cmr6 n=1 Tax=Herpetosiphon llansteffanensis TaxID=2094568 RepID=UPI000D7C39C4|nr:type III-B CRISPR module RAMP protein Cmr6 [Herpetosiphon llansteffanensis]